MSTKLGPPLLNPLQVCNKEEWSIAVESGKKLTYAHEILCYGVDGRDRRKDLLLQENGFFVLRFLAEDVGKQLDMVLDAILRTLSHRRKT